MLKATGARPVGEDVGGTKVLEDVALRLGAEAQKTGQADGHVEQDHERGGGVGNHARRRVMPKPRWQLGEDDGALDVALQREGVQRQGAEQLARALRPEGRRGWLTCSRAEQERPICELACGQSETPSSPLHVAGVFSACSGVHQPCLPIWSAQSPRWQGAMTAC